MMPSALRLRSHEFVIPTLARTQDRYYLVLMTTTNQKLTGIELQNVRAALRVKLAAEMGRSPFDRQVIREANAQLRNAGRL